MIALFELLFGFGTLAFWITLAVLMIGIWVFEENERWLGATMWVVGTIVALLFANPTWLAGIKAHPTNLIFFAAAYVVIGVVYGIGRWKLFLVDLLERARNGDTFENPSKQTFVRYKGRHIQLPPNARDFKARITGWMAYWPWSGLWFLLHDPITRLYRYIYETLAGFLQGMSDKTFAEFQKKEEK